MEETVPAYQIAVGDIIKCICQQGCVRPDQCQNPCPSSCTGTGISCGCISTNCGNAPKGKWERVLRIQAQPSVQYNWIHFSLTHDKGFGVWDSQAIIRYKGNFRIPNPQPNQPLLRHSVAGVDR